MPRFPTVLATLALVAASAACAQPRVSAVRVLDPRHLPPGVRYAARAEAARQWTDRTGDNLLLLTRGDEAPTPGSDDSWRDRELHAYHYVRQGSGWRLLWQTNDFVRECLDDVTLNFVPGSLQVTDADKDGVAETAFAYRVDCRGDPGPADLKVIMHEGATKYAIRGTGDMRHLGSGYPAPQMRMDPALAANPALRAAAVRLWNRSVREPAEEETGAP